MLANSNKTFSKKNHSVDRNENQRQGGVKTTFQFTDNRPESNIQRKLQVMMDNSSSTKQLKVIQNISKNHSKELERNPGYPVNTFVQKKLQTDIAPVQRVAVSNAAMWSLFKEKRGDEWFFWGKGGNHVGAIRPGGGTGEVTEFHVKKEFKGAKTNRIDWLANDNTYDEVEPPTKLEYNNVDALNSMKTLGEETKNLLVRNKK